MPVDHPIASCVVGLDHCIDKAAVFRHVVAVDIDAVDLKAFVVASFQRPVVEAASTVNPDPLIADGDAAAAVAIPPVVERVSATPNHVAVAVLET